MSDSEQDFWPPPIRDCQWCDRPFEPETPYDRVCRECMDEVEAEVEYLIVLN